MYRPRRSGDFRHSFTFGGRMPAVIGLVLTATLLATVGSWIQGNRGWAVLSPELVQAGEWWRLVSWPFVQLDPLTLAFGGLMIWQFGSQLAYDWGEGRFLWTFAILTAGAGLLTFAVGLLVPGLASLRHVGMWPVVNGLWLMWCMRYPDQQVSFWGVLPMTGRTMALLIVGGTALFGLYLGGVGGIFQMVPHFAALLLGWSLSRSRMALPLRRWKLAWRDFRLERQAKRRARHLKVVRKNGHDEPPRWMN